MRIKRIIFGKDTDVKRFPVFLTIIVGLLVAFSLVCISSASYRPLGEGEWMNEGFHVKQIIWLILSLIVFFAIIRVPYYKFTKFAFLFYLFCLLLLVAVFIFGSTVNGAKRWLNIKVMLFQPSELTKLAVIFMLAVQLKFSKSIRKFKGLIKPVIIVGIPWLMIMKQPDLGTSLVLVPIALAMLLVAGVKKRYVFSFILICIILAPIAYFFVMKDYQRDRIDAFMNPEKFARSDGYHLIQSRTAIGAGKIFGAGYRKGTQNVLGYLPENQTDFIFSVVGEEWGFVGSVAVIILYFLLLSQILIIAADTRDPLGRFICVGIGVLFAFQIFENIGMTVGLMPITGLTLPFFSYGGSSLICCFTALAFVVNIRIHPINSFADNLNQTLIT